MAAPNEADPTQPGPAEAEGHGRATERILAWAAPGERELLAARAQALQEGDDAVDPDGDQLDRDERAARRPVDRRRSKHGGSTESAYQQLSLESSHRAAAGPCPSKQKKKAWFW